MIFGFALTKEALLAGTVAGVLTASDLSVKTCKEVNYYCQKQKIPVCSIPLTISEIGMITGRSAGVIAVSDKGFFDRIYQLCQNTELSD